MAYNLPPPWDPGFAMPSNALDEGLERRAFVTRQAPRGTYDDPRVGTAGYAVPAYVIKEGIGQGAMVTKWAQRGRYDIPVPQSLNARPKVLGEQRLPGGGTKVTMDALSGTDLPASYQRFGARAAAVIMQRVGSLPAQSRKAALKKILDALDPKLWNRTATIAETLVKGGASPAAAVQTALGRAMSEGAAAEVLNAGRTGRQPSPHSIMGFGAYGASFCLAMGDEVTPIASLRSLVTSKLSASTVAQQAQPQIGQCSSDGIYIFKASAAGGGYWARRSASDVCKSTYAGGPTSGGTQGGATVTNTQTGQLSMTNIGGATVGAAPESPKLEMVEVGGWLLVPKAAKFTIRRKFDPGQVVPAEWAQEIIRVMTTGTGVSAYNGANTQVGTFFPGLGESSIYVGWFGAVPYDWNTVPIVNSPRWRPIAKFKNPVDGKPYAIWIGFAYKGHTPGDHLTPKEMGTLPPRLWVYVGPVNPEESTIREIWNFIKEVAVKVVDVAKDVFDAVADLACGLANAANAAQTGGAIGVAAGAGAAVGTAGAQIVKAACGQPPPAPEDTTAGGATAGGGLPILPLAIAGGAVGLVYLLTRKK